MAETDEAEQKKRSLYDAAALLERRETSGVGPAWPAVLLSIPAGLCGSVYTLAVGGGLVSALLVYVLASVSALIVALCLSYQFPLNVRSSHVQSDVRYFRARSFGRRKNDVVRDAEATSASGASSFQMGAPQPDPAEAMLAHVLIASLGGYGASVAVFLLMAPVHWLLVVSAFLPGALLTVGALFLLRRLLVGRS